MNTHSAHVTEIYEHRSSTELRRIAKILQARASEAHIRSFRRQQLTRNWWFVLKRIKP